MKLSKFLDHVVDNQFIALYDSSKDLELWFGTAEELTFKEMFTDYSVIFVAPGFNRRFTYLIIYVWNSQKDQDGKINKIFG